MNGAFDPYEIRIHVKLPGRKSKMIYDVVSRNREPTAYNILMQCDFIPTEEHTILVDRGACCGTQAKKVYFDDHDSIHVKKMTFEKYSEKLDRLEKQIKKLKGQL